MDYRVLIFMTREMLAAIDIDTGGKTDTISLDGNDVMGYSSQEEIREFCQHIKNYYNIDAFSDLGMAIFILRFDAVMEDVSVLLKEIQEATEYNLLSVEKVLPWIVLKEGLLKPDTTIQIRTFDVVYTVSLGNDFVMQCQIGGEKEHSFVLPKEKLAECDHLSEKVLFGDEEGKNALSKKYDREIEKLKKQLEVEKEKTKAAENNLTKIVSKIYEIREEKKRNASRTICKMQCKDKEVERKFLANNLQNNSIYSSYLFGLWKIDEYFFYIKYCHYDAEVIEKGQKIAKVEVWSKNCVDEKGVRRSTEDFIIKATASGRLFWLQEPETELSYGADIAVIGDVSDTKEEILKWYAKNK